MIEEQIRVLEHTIEETDEALTQFVEAVPVREEFDGGWVGAALYLYSIYRAILVLAVHTPGQR